MSLVLVGFELVSEKWKAGIHWHNSIVREYSYDINVSLGEFFFLLFTADLGNCCDLTLLETSSKTLQETYMRLKVKKNNNNSKQNS